MDGTGVGIEVGGGLYKYNPPDGINTLPIGYPQALDKLAANCPLFTTRANLAAAPGIQS